MAVSLIMTSLLALTMQAFEPELDWGRFGVRVAQRDIPKLGDMLDSFTEEQVKEMQVGAAARWW